MIFDIIGFIICAIIIFLAGKKLSLYGDLLAEITGLGKAWIGLILMSAVTSLPELMVGISSVAIIGDADLAVGDIFGSCAFNLGILSLMDFFTPKNKPLFTSASKSHIMAAAFGALLIAIAGLGIFLGDAIILSPYIGFTSFAFVIVYLISLRVIYNYQSAQPKTADNHTSTSLNKQQIVIRYIAFASVIILTALALPHFAERIAMHTGLGKSFVGTLFLAVSTSLPEIAVSIAAVRMGSADMAVGNLMGSNIFNVFILFLDDLFYARGPLLQHVSSAHLISVFMVLIMSMVAIIGLMFPSQNRRFFLATDTLVILLLYVINIILLYIFG